MHAYDFKSGYFGYNVLSLDEMTCELADTTSYCQRHAIIPESVTFKGRELKVVKVGASCFRGSSSLVSIDLPNSITEISSKAFMECPSLVSVNMPSSMTKIGDDAFWCCKSLKTIDIPDGIKDLSANTFCGCETLASVNLPNSLKTIDTGAFAHCASLEFITLPNNLTHIGLRAFSKTGIKSVDIPDSVCDIDEDTFEDCSQLQELVIGSGINYLIAAKYFNPIYRPTYISYIRGCKNLHRLIIKESKNPEDYFEIDSDNYYFDNLLQTLPLRELYLGKKLKCEYLHGTDKIEFKSLQKITFGSNFKPESENDTWINLRKLPKTATIYCENPVPYNLLGTFFSNEQYLNCILYVPTESIDVYKNAEGWKNFWDIRGFDFSSGIEDVTEITRDVYNVYNIHGNYILRTRNKEDLNNLQKGIYIINGKKIMIP